MKKLSLLFFCSIIFHFTYSQDKHIIKLRTSQRDLISIPNRPFFISNVIDSRKDTSNVGIVQKGMANRKVQAVLEGGTITYFSNLFEASLLNINMDEKLIPIVVEIKDLTVSEWTTFSSEKGRLEMTIIFYKLNANNELEPTFSSEIIEESGGMDVTAAHTYRIRDGVKKSIEKLNDFLVNPEGKIAYYSDVDLQKEKFMKEDGLTITNYESSTTEEDNIFTCSHPRKGIFRTFDELKANRPSITNDVREDFYKDSTRLKLRSLVSGKLIKGSFFAYSDGKNIFIFAQNYQPARYYSKVFEKGTFIAWKDNFYDSGEVATRTAVQAAFGLAGTLIYSASKDIDCVVLDSRTGLIQQASPKMINQILKDDSDLLTEYNSETGKRNTDRLLYIIKKYNERHPVK